MMMAIDVVLCDVVDDDSMAAFADFIANGRLDGQFAACHQAKFNLVESLADDPAVFGNPGDGGEPHTRRLADDVKDRRHHIDVGNGPPQQLPDCSSNWPKHVLPSDGEKRLTKLPESASPTG
jgi:hypothetical protein